jgi:hypothetical protein
VCLAWWCVPVATQQPPPVTGRVIDAFSMRPISGAVIEAPGAKATTDAEGRFRLALPLGTVRLKVTADGYLPDEADVTVGASPVTVEVLLLNRAQFKENVVVTAGTVPVAQSPSTIEVSPQQVRTVAGAGENVFKVLQTLPGVNATNDFDSRLSVRGGGPDQNLTIMDGVEIHDPYRLFGLTSAFNPETVENFELTAGGFSAKYGDRLSSILLIENRAGTRAKAFAGSASLGFTDGNVVLEGKLPGAMAGSWIVTGRRTYYDLVADKIIGQKLPTFGDLQAKVVWELRPGRRLTLVALRSREHTDAKFDLSGGSDHLGLLNAARNDLVSLSFFSTIGQRASSKTIVSWYRYTDGLDVSGSFLNDAARSNEPEGSAFARAQTVFAVTRDLGVRDLSIRQELAVKAGAAHFIETGFEAHVLDTRWGWAVTGLDQANGPSVGLPSLLDSRQGSSRAGGWLLDHYQASTRIALEPGVRVDWSELAREVTVSPRFAANVALGGGFRVRGAAGLFTQSPGYEKLLQSDNFVDLSSAQALHVKSERAVHALASLERDLAPGLIARAEGYYKSFDRLIVGELETPAETAARVAQYDFPPALASSVPSAPKITNTPINGATGRAYGFDVYLVRRPSSASARLSGWASYTWGHADIDAYGRRYPFDYDRRHAVSVVGTFRITSLFEMGATVRIASGFPYTPVKGLRIAALAITDSVTGATRYVPQRDASGLYVWTTDPGGVGDLNSGRLPVFARVDLRATFKPQWNQRRWQFYVEVINALNRKNAGAYETQLVYDPGSDRPRITQEPTASLPLIPSFGVRFRM